MWTSWLVALAMAEEPGALLAPAPEELVQAEQELQRRVLQAEAIGRAASRLQNATTYAEDPCESDFLVRARAFGQAWRDAAQRARVQADRTGRIAASTTLLPLVNDERQAAIAALGERAERQAMAWLEFDRLDEKSRSSCEGPMQPGPGLPDPTPRAPGEVARPVAIWVLSGNLCPGRGEVDGVAVVSGDVCVGVDSVCGCTPKPVLPGAVLSP